jgi:hypothetical protein
MKRPSVQMAFATEGVLEDYNPNTGDVIIPPVIPLFRWRTTHVDLGTVELVLTVLVLLCDGQGEWDVGLTLLDVDGTPIGERMVGSVNIEDRLGWCLITFPVRIGVSRFGFMFFSLDVAGDQVLRFPLQVAPEADPQ